MRRPIARLTRIVDGWFPVRRIRMTGAVAAALTAYATMLALQLSVVAPVPGEASTASPVVIGGGLLSISADTGVCVLPVCLLAPRCAASVGGGCLLPAGSPPPAAPKPAPPAPPAAAPAAPAAAPAVPTHPASAHPGAAARSAPHAAAAHAAVAKAPAPIAEITRVDRPVIAAPVQTTPPLTSGGALPTAPVVVAAPVPVPAPWWLYAIFVAVDGAAAVALTVLIRRTAAAQAGG